MIKTKPISDVDKAALLDRFLYDPETGVVFHKNHGSPKPEVTSHV